MATGAGREAGDDALQAARRAEFVEWGSDGFCRLTLAGRAHLRQALGRPAAAPNDSRAASPARPVAAPSVAVMRDDESPISWLARRRGKDGKPLLAGELVDAAERLRADYWFAGLSPSVTTNWAAFGAGCGQRPALGTAAELRDSTMAARERVNRALKAVGPDFASLLVDVCCHLKGLERIEREAGWPQRAGRIVLTLALTQLARHYGILNDTAHIGAAGRPRARHWGAADYKPTIEHWREDREG